MINKVREYRRGNAKMDNPENWQNEVIQNMNIT
jgi:hypothetical protein